LDESNLELEVSCRILSINTGVVVAMRNHGGQNATLAAGRVIVVLRRYVAQTRNKCGIRAETRSE
jgi:hypothetical protein